uniref:Uncharacterized protein n=1 Tax=Medicago truncatula TaxID=3880 RepID=I3T2X9_MEDTR|nr:unknown [Medicago truncatula]
MSVGEGLTVLLNEMLCNEAMDLLRLLEFTRTLCSTLLYFPLL